MRRLIVLPTVLTVACSSPPPAPVEHAERPRARREVREEPRAASGPRPTGGSSDGVTCEEARNTVGEDLTIGKKGGKDLDARELGAALNDGAFLGACDVPQTTKVALCAAVKNGAAVGVTVAMSPSDSDLEKCVAAKVRALAFPVSPRLDVVKTDF